MSIRVGLAIVALGMASPAMAEENYFEGWFEGTVAADIDKRTFVQFQTQQRARDENNPAGNSHIYRLWLGRRLGGGVSLSGGLHRSKEGTVKETRLIEQLSYPIAGALKGRTRIEQRFIDDADQTGWRVRQRLGLALPLAKQMDGVDFVANAEGFLTLRPTSVGGQRGLTGLRTFVGVERSFGQVDASIGYTRHQSIRRDAPDRVGHAPTLNLTLNL